MMFKKVSLLSIATGLIILGFITIFSQISHAVTASEWRAGNIINDALFIDANSMNVTQIQEFLNRMVGTGYYGRVAGQCDTNGLRISELGGGTRAQYGAAHSNPIPFTCLKDFYEVPKTVPGPGIPANNYGGKAIPTGAKSAAQLIWDAAQKYDISPKVLLIKLGTESAGPLTSDDWPFLNQYTYAMGAHCPDSGPGGSANCDTNYSGFSIQISEAAKMLRGYLDNMMESWWPYRKPYQTNSIYWNVVQSGCGASDVFIENRATAALYTYTPYQPNQAALNNMYGTGDGCSAYGNRNFWRTYNDWFGSTTSAATYSYSMISKNIYSDATYKTKISSAPTVEPNQVFYVKITIKNTGNQVWYSDNLRIGGANPENRGSVFATDDWISAGRPASMNEDYIKGGETATFTFAMKAPPYLGGYSESFVVLIEGDRWLNGVFTIPITVASPSPYYSVKTLSFNTYSDSVMTQKIDPSKITKYTGSKVYVKTAIKNTGNQIFPAGLTKLATSNPIDRDSAYSDATWLSTGRIVLAKEGKILPGGTGTFIFQLTAPSTPLARRNEQFGLLIEGQRWLSYNVGIISVQTNQRPPMLINSGQTIYMGDRLLSKDERYRLILQGDGNLVLYSPTKAIWASYTVGKGGKRLVMQGDGNLVLYDSKGKAVWDSLTAGKGPSRLVMQSDGNLVIYNKTSYTWASWTFGEK